MTATGDAPQLTRARQRADRASTSAGRRREVAQHGALMARAIKLRDQVASGRRRADTSRTRSWAQIAVGVLVVAAGLTVLYATDPAWNWTGAVAVGLGPTVAMLGVIDLARSGLDGEQRVERIFRGIRECGAVVTALLISMEVLTATIAAVLLGAAVASGDWSDEVLFYLTNALTFAVMASGTMMMVSVAELRPIALARGGWWRLLAAFRQFTTIAVPVVLVGAAVALSLRDTWAVAVAMVSLATVFIGWARVDRAATGEAIRRLAEAADAVAVAVRPIVACSEPDPIPQSQAHRVLEALETLEIACHLKMRSGMPARPRYLVDDELIIVVRACRAAFVDWPIEHAAAALTAAVSRELAAMDRRLLARELLVFAADIRRLATLTPGRVIAG